MNATTSIQVNLLISIVKYESPYRSISDRQSISDSYLVIDPIHGVASPVKDCVLSVRHVDSVGVVEIGLHVEHTSVVAEERVEVVELLLGVGLAVLPLG